MILSGGFLCAPWEQEREGMTSLTLTGTQLSSSFIAFNASDNWCRELRHCTSSFNTGRLSDGV